jgi:hypothetical protein
MPGSIGNLDTLYFSKIRKTRYIMLFIAMILFTLIFSQRIFNIQSDEYIIYVTSLILMVFATIIASGYFTNNTNSYLSTYNNIFNSPKSRNYLSVIALVLFIIFIYEIPEYDNNEPNYFVNLFTFNNNKYISNRFMGMSLIIIFTIYAAHTIYLTTKEIS